MQHTKIRQYLDIMCSQIRYKKIHKEICEEIGNHMYDQTEAYKAQGMDEEGAITKAVEQMGDPVEIGTEFDRTHRPKPEWSIIVLSLLMLLAGFLIRLLVSSRDDGSMVLFYRQLIFSAVGIGLMIFSYCIDFTILGKYPKIVFLLLTASVIALIALSPLVNGRSIYAFYLLLLYPTAYAGIVYRMRSKGYLGIIVCGLFLTLSIIISSVVPSITASVLITAICILLLTMAIMKGWFHVKKPAALVLVYLPMTAVSLILLASLRGSLVKRISIAFYPQLEQQAGGWVGTITRQMLSGAKFAGHGTLPENLLKISDTRLLPGTNSDFLLTYLIHTFGWFIFLIVAALVIIFTVRAFYLCTKQTSILAKLVSIAAVSTIAMEALFYISANLGFPLFDPLSLPLISQSSSFLLVNMCLVGILLSVFKTGYFIRDKGGNASTSDSFVKMEDGKLIIDFNHIKTG